LNPNFSSVMSGTGDQRGDFFKLIFGVQAEGYICIAFISPTSRDIKEFYFKYPEDLPKLLKCITDYSQTPSHAYFCPQLFSKPKRNKDNVVACPSAWADLDTCNPALLAVEPSVTIMTSPGRYQALWVFVNPMTPNDAEDISRRIAYFHAEHGADKSGWDLTQLLRIPYTTNYKYGETAGAPMVVVTNTTTRVYRKADFNLYPEVAASVFLKAEMPSVDTNENPLDLMQRYRATLNPNAFGLFNTIPANDDDWSTRLWKLILLLVESGMGREQVFQVVKFAKCNKYERDGRPDSDLWHEILRAYVKHSEARNTIPNLKIPLPDFMTEEERDIAQDRQSFIERYIDWAKELTDAPPQYHQAGAFVALSGMLAGNLRLRTSFGTVLPNMWFMILADTTLTRKTTAMNLSLAILEEIDDNVMFATDGSMEGIMTGLKMRDGEPSIFFRDEFTGLLSAMTHKDYMSDMPEHLTKLYDGKAMKRLLRKEEIVVRKPVFIILAGGIKSKVQTLLTEEHIASGFVPRFVFITAEADLSNVRPVGPPDDVFDEGREIIKNELIDLRAHYTQNMKIRRGDHTMNGGQDFCDVMLTPEAWARYNDFETTMTKSALETGLAYLTPVYDRLCKSTLKAAMLIAASRQRGSVVTVDILDLLHAMYYANLWRSYANEVIHGVGKSPEERLIDKIIVQVKNTPGGISRSELMNYHRLNSKQAGAVFQTMIERSMIYGTSLGANNMLFHPVGGKE
jgi:hypothetical protein